MAPFDDRGRGGNSRGVKKNVRAGGPSSTVCASKEVSK